MPKKKNMQGWTENSNKSLAPLHPISSPFQIINVNCEIISQFSWFSWKLFLQKWSIVNAQEKKKKVGETKIWYNRKKESRR